MKRLVTRALRRSMRALGIELPVRWRLGRRLKPISRSFGLDRGHPIDRYYIEAFLALHRLDVRGHVLEAGGLVNYTKSYGDGRVAKSDIMYPESGHEDGTIVANLETGAGLPMEAFDCLILTQVYPFIYDVRAAVANSHRALKPGGVLLATLPGISQISRYDLERWGDYWRFTAAAARRLFAEAFGEDNVVVESHGNVLTACAFLHGLAIGDLTRKELDHEDPDYQLLICVRAVKAPTDDGVPRGR